MLSWSARMYDAIQKHVSMHEIETSNPRKHKPSHSNILYFTFYFYKKYWKKIFLHLFIFDREHKWGRSRERGRHRIWSRAQALSCQHRAWCGAWTCEPRDRDLSQSQMLNRLSHPGAPMLLQVFKSTSNIETLNGSFGQTFQKPHW